MDPVDFIVVGGGVSGLGVAASLKARGWQVLLLEAKPRLDGMGLFIGRSRGLRTLAVLFSSSLCPARAPSEYVLLTARVGGVSCPDVVNMKDEALVKLVAQELAGPLQTRESPNYYSVVRWPDALPQYERDHGRVEETCQTIEKECPGLYLLGNYRGGIWVDDCLGNAHRLSQRLGQKA